MSGQAIEACHRAPSHRRESRRFVGWRASARLIVVLMTAGIMATAFAGSPALAAGEGDAGGPSIMAAAVPPGGTCPPVNIVINTASTLYQFDSVSGAQLSAVPLDPGSGAYGDISYDATGTVLYGIGYPSSNILYTIDQTTGGYSNARPLAGAVLTDTATQPVGTTNHPSVWNGLSPEANGLLLLGGNTTNQIYELDPATGDTTHFALFPTGIVSAGDFLVLPSGQILAVGIDYANPGSPMQSLFYLIDPTTKALTEIGTGPQTFGAAQSGGNIYLATADGSINYIAVASLPTSTSTLPLSTLELSNPGLSFYGATSIQDDGECNLSPITSYTVAKTASTPGPVRPGETVTYTVTVTNTGTIAYTPLSAGFTDDLSEVLDDATYVAGSATASAGSVSVAGNTLSWLGPLAVAPDAGSTATVTYQVKIKEPAGGDGSLVNGAVATGAGGSCASDGACTTTVDVMALSIAKSATPASVSAVGDVISYSFLVKNTGNVTLHSINVTDVQTAPAGALDAAPVCPDTTLAPAATTTCTATYTVTQADLDNGSVHDSATAQGTPPTGDPVDSQPSTASVPSTQTPAITMVKSATPASVSAVGDVISYSFLVKNTGNVTLHSINVTDVQTAPAGVLDAAPVCPDTTLAPAATTTCTATYTVTQADLDNGSVHDSATAQGTPPTGDPVDSQASTATVTVASSAGALAETGNDTQRQLIFVGLLLGLGGLFLIATQRRRQS